MALRGTVSNANTSGSTTGITLNLASITGLTAGDIILLEAIADLSSATFTITGSTFSTVGSLTNMNIAGGEGTITLMAPQYLVATGSEGTITIQVASTSHFYSVTARAYSGRSATPFVVTPTQTGPIASSTPPHTLSITGLTANASDDLVVFVGGGQAASTSDTFSFTAPTGYANSVIEQAAATSFAPIQESADNLNVSAGATGTLGGSVNNVSGVAFGWGGYVISIAAAPPAANYTFVNQLDYSTTTGATSISSNGPGGPNNTISLALGNLFIAGYYDTSPTPGSGSMLDSLGNNYNSIGSVVGGAGQAMEFYAGIVTHAGAATVTAVGSGTNINTMFVQQYAPTTGYAIAAIPTVIAGHYVNGNATGTDAIVSPANPIAIQAGIYLLYGFNFQLSATAVNTAGTSPIAFTGRGNIWEVYNGTIGPAIAEDALINSTGGTYEVTFGSTTIKQVWSILAAFAIGRAAVPGGPIPRCLYIMP